jgi:hypothetical protein
MRAVTVTLALGLLTPSLARATTCQVGTLQSYIDLGSAGCSIEDKNVSGFLDLGVIGGATPIVPGNITVTPISTPGNPGLTFDFGATASAGEFLQSLFAFSVVVLPGGGALEAVSLELLGSEVERDGVNTALLCAGTTDPACPTPDIMILFDIGSDFELSGTLALLSLGALDLVLDVGVDAGISGSASLSAATIRFQEGSGGAVPEPAVGIPFGAALLTLGLVRRRSRRTK